MPATYDCIATTTLGSNQTDITFSSISSNYTDLILVVNAGQVTADNFYAIQVGNGSIDTGSNYSDTALNGNGSTASSYRNTSSTRALVAGSNDSAVKDNIIVHFQNYSNTTTNKTILSRANITAYRVVATVSLWRSTSAINTIKIYGGANLLSGSTATLYGIKAA